MLVLGIDFESTGIDVKNDRIIEVGAIVYDTEIKAPMEILSEFIIPDFDLPHDYISPTGIRKDWLVKHGKPFSRVLGSVQKIMANSEPVAVVAHNGDGFDRPLVFEELKRHLFSDHALESTPWVDTQHAIPYPPAFTSRRLKYLAADHGIANPFEHRAVFDVMTMLSILSKYDFLEVFEESKKPWITIRILANYDNRQKAKELRYTWESDKQIWIKRIKEKEFEFEKSKAKDKNLEIIIL